MKKLVTIISATLILLYFTVSRSYLSANWVQTFHFPFVSAYESMTGFVTSKWNTYFYFVGLSKAYRESEYKRSQAELRNLKLNSALHKAKEKLKNYQFFDALEFDAWTYDRVFQARDGGYEMLRLLPTHLQKDQPDSVSAPPVKASVLSSSGLVGRVIRSTEWFVDAQTLTDHEFAVDALLERTQERGLLRGYDPDHCLMEFNNRVDVRLNDRILTSGLTEEHPPGIPIGTVVKILYDEKKLSQQIFVKPYVKLSEEKHFYIVKNHQKVDFQAATEPSSL